MTSDNFSHSPFELYKKRIEDGSIESDEDQLCAIKALDEVYNKLNAFLLSKNNSSFLSIFSNSKKNSEKIKGLYMYGGVGRGKTMIMDLFYESFEFEDKKRVHFHQFMSEIHAKAAKLRKKIQGDVIEVIAHDIAKEIKLLCFDEMHVNDIADAMIIGRLFNILWDQGIIVVATSNIQNDNYKAIMLKAIADRFAEALAEHLHELVRKKYWGYAKNEKLTNDDLIKEQYQGIRPAAGYPAQPDHSEKQTIFDLLQATKILDIELTESYAMSPASSVSGLYFSHPQSSYFGIGKIANDQLEDYAKRKNITKTELKRLIPMNISE